MNACNKRQLQTWLRIYLLFFLSLSQVVYITQMKFKLEDSFGNKEEGGGRDELMSFSVLNFWMKKLFFLKLKFRMRTFINSSSSLLAFFQLNEKDSICSSITFCSSPSIHPHYCVFIFEQQLLSEWKSI